MYVRTHKCEWMFNNKPHLLEMGGTQILKRYGDY